MAVYSELVVDENTRAVEVRYIDEDTGLEVQGLARKLRGLAAQRPDLALLIRAGRTPESIRAEPAL